MQTTRSHFGVLHALILRDMRTRFGRTHFGYLIVVGWPLVHMAMIVSILVYVNKVVVNVSGDPAVFIATGVMPYILCLYPARMLGYAIEMNKPLFLFSIIKPFDLILSRAIVEFMTAIIVTLLFFIVAFVMGIDMTPNDSFELLTGILATIYLSLSIGFFNTIMVSLFRMWHVVFILFMLIVYTTSGTLLMPSTLSQATRDIMWFNPLLHCVEWIRSAYYEGYGDDMLSKSYLLWTATVILFVGLLGERFVRGKLMAQ